MYRKILVIATLWALCVPCLPAQKTSANKLVTAAAQGDLDELKKLLLGGAAVDATSRHGLTALHAAKIHGHDAAAAFLVSKGADANIAMPAPEQIVDTFLRQRIKDASPGLAVLVSRDGKIVFEKTYGHASLAHEVAVTPKTKFRIGSITKQFTAAAILKLEEDGKLSRKDTLSKFVPDFPRGDTVTIEHLLHHTSGIHSYTSKPRFLETVTVPVEPEKLIESIKEDPYDFDPGQSWSYNNSGYFLLGYIVEKVSGESYEAFLRKHFFKPFGMHETGVHDARTLLADEAFGYSYEDGKLKKAVDWNMSRAGGAGALYSTIGDLHRWNEGIFAGRVLSEATLTAAFTPVKLPKGKPRLPYGYGWVIAEHRGLREIAHGGGLHGFLSYLARYPEQKLTVVVLVNCSPPAPGFAPSSLSRQIAEFYLWKDMKPRPARAVAKGIDVEAYDDYVGRYDFSGVILTVTRKENRLFAQLTGQGKLEIFPRSETEFFWKVVEADITFVKNEKGEVVHAIQRQGGRKVKAVKLVHQTVAKIDPAVLDACVGKYDYGKGATLTVTKKGARLFGRLTGQPTLELLPRSTTEFFWKDVNAEITFVKDEDGKVIKGVHRQRGRTFDVPKVE